MKKQIFAGIMLAVTCMSFAQATIYSGDGTLASNRIVTMGGRNLTFKSTTGNFYINGASGFTGVNTLTPTTALDVNGSIKGTVGIFTKFLADGQSFADNTARITGSMSLTAGYPAGTTEAPEKRTFVFLDMPQSNLDGASTIWLDLANRNNNSRFRFRAVQGGNSQFICFDKNQATNFQVTDDVNGNVFATMPKANSFLGIGTTSFTDGTDTYKLSVAGNIRAQRVKVYTTWADYVFEDNYALPTLEAVEKYINAEGHLKDIPSAKEVEEKGIELGEMNKLLLQKIEELTLYTIELNKQLQELKKELNK